MSQDTSNPYGLREGLPQADDYTPEAVGTADITAGNPEQTFPEFGLEMVPVMVDGEDIGRRLLRRNGKFIADVSEDYRLVPNEHAVAAANKVAQRLGAVAFHDFDGDWYIELDDHVFMDEDGRRVHALYAWDDPVDVTGDGDTIQFGFAVHNSIDASLAFQVGLFTFRHACANMVFMGLNAQGMSFDQRQVVQFNQRKHTKGLDMDVDGLADQIQTMLTLREDITETYRAWHEQVVTPEDVEGLLRRLPRKDLPMWMRDAHESIEDAEQNEQLDGEELTRERRLDIIQWHIPQTTVWDTYNDITESLWHRGESNDMTRRNKMKKLHRVFTPAEGVR